MSSSILPPDKNMTCIIPFALADRVYIRTGTHGDGSCFLHAYLKAIRPQYKYASYEDRLAYVNRLREKLASSVSNETLSELGNREPRRILFFAELGKIIDDGFPKDERGSLLNQLVDIRSIFQETTGAKGNFYRAFIDKIHETARAKIGQKYSKLEKYVIEWCHEIFGIANEAVLKNYKEKLLHDQVDSMSIEFISRRVECNFLFLREVDGKIEVYPFLTQVFQSWPFVVLLWTDECHYEVIGEMRPDRTVKRKFGLADDLIQNILRLAPN
jgi:hypothetical protein